MLAILCFAITLAFGLSGEVLAHTDTRAYRPSLMFGQEGREAGFFRQPSSVVVDPAGLLYVADTYNHRIQVFTHEGRFVRAFGAEGGQLGSLSRPKGLAWGPHGLLYVADMGNHRVQAFDMQGKAVFTLGSFGQLPGQFHAPEGVALDLHGTLYVADTQNHRVQKFGPDGHFSLSWGGSGSGRGEFLEPTAIALDPDERVFVADAQNHRIQVFTPDGHYLWEIGKAGRGAGEFDGPRGVATDEQGYIYVADTGNGRVQIFDRSGRHLMQVGHLGKQPQEFYYPAGLWIDAERTVSVADTVNHRVQQLAYSPALAQLEEGWQAFHAAHVDAALAKWGEALRLDPTLTEALYGSALAYARQGKAGLAIEQLQAALALQPDYTAARWALYRLYLGKLRLPLLAVALIAALSAGTLTIRRLRRRALRERARRLLEAGRIDETISTYEHLLHLDRTDVEVCKALEILYAREGLEEKRTLVNEIIARLEPENLHALSYLGKQQLAEHRFEDAQQTWERILYQDPERAEGYFYRGAVLAERGEVEQAQASYHRALALEIKARQVRSDEPPSDAARADGGAVRDPSPLESVMNLWERVLTESVRSERALTSFREARRTLAQQHVTQGHAHLQRDDSEAALAYLRWVTALNPADDTGRALLTQAQTRLTFDRGLRYYEAQEYVEAIRWFQETLALDGEHEKAKRYLRYAQQCLEGGVSERFRHLDLGDREK
ncbi:MAG: hypothetical protein HYZ81_15640 [Nitrospinae bacterium]|nr:hypothetical protein [Nitrospinota bacterium]